MTTDRIFKVTKINPLLMLLIFGVVIVGLFWLAKGLFKKPGRASVRASDYDSDR